MSLAAADQGSFGAGDFAELLRQFHAAGASGRLDVELDQRRCSLFLACGSVAGVAVNEERYRLGSWLVARGAIEPGGMARALLEQPDNMPFGKYLVEEGLLDDQRLREELQLRAAAVVGLLLFTAGSYRFVSGDRLAEEALTMDLTTTALLLEAARSTDGARLEDSVVTSAAVLRADPAALERARDVVLSPEEAFLLSRLHAETSAGDLRKLVPMGEPELLRTLGALVIAGLAELRGEDEVAGVRPQRRSEQEAPRPTPGFTAGQDRERREVRRLAAELSSRDHYRRLGLTRGATIDQVHVRFKEMARLYDPERAAEPHLASLRPELERIQASLLEAYRTLIDPVQRGRYDSLLRSGAIGARESLGAEDREREARRQLVDANVRRAHELIRLGETGEAVKMLTQATRLDPQPDTFLTLARLELKNPMWSQRALDHLRAALAIDPRLTEAWLELASFWERRQRKDRQRDCLRKVLEYDPANRDVQRLLLEAGAR